MKNKKSYVILALMITVVIIAGFIPYTITEETNINAPLLDISRRLTDTGSWHNWDTSFYNKNSKQAIALAVINPTVFQLNPRSTDTQIIVIYPSTDKDLTVVRWVAQKKGFQWLWEKAFDENLIVKQLNAFKKYMESTEGLYGFPILLTKNNDSLICARHKVISTPDARTAIAQQLLLLRQWITHDHIQIAGNYYQVAQFPLINGKTSISVSMPVKNRPLKSDSVSILSNPAGTYVLIGSYHGKPNGIRKLYDAMDRYVMDKGLHKAAQPMEEYISDSDFLHPKDSLSLKIIYPVY